MTVHVRVLGCFTLAKHPQNFGYNRNNKVIFLEFLPKIENCVLKCSFHCEELPFVSLSVE